MLLGGGVDASRLVLSDMKYRAIEAIIISLNVELYTTKTRCWLQRPIQLPHQPDDHEAGRVMRFMHYRGGKNLERTRHTMGSSSPGLLPSFMQI